MAHVITMDLDILRVTLFEALTPGDLAEIMREADEIERNLDPVPHRITIQNGVTDIQIGYKEIKAFAWHRREIRFPNVFRSAIVVSSPVQRGLARMFQTLNNNPQIVIEIFDDEGAALEWLRG